MNDLKTLFEQALGGEPGREVPMHEDIARGRALRARRLRRRAGGGALVAAAVAAGLVLPSSPVSVVDGGAANAPNTSGGGGGAVLSPEVADDPLKLALWEAVDDALPDDVELVEGSYVYGDSPGPNLYLSLERGDVPFSLSVWLQNARPDLPEYRPCTAPDPLIGEFGRWTDCQEGTDDEGRWRVSGVEGPNTFLAVEGGPAAVALRWGVNDTADEADDEGRPLEVTTALTDAEADAVADAAWSLGAQHEPADLVSGIDLAATAGPAWPEIVAAVESALGLGPLTAAEPAEADVVAEVDGVPVQTGTVSATYTTGDGVQVDLAVWQRDRVYQPLCLAAYGECDMFPGGVLAFGDGDGDGDGDRDRGHGVSGTAGQRGTMRLKVHTDDPALERAVSRAAVEGLQRVPFLGDERYPLPEDM